MFDLQKFVILKFLLMELLLKRSGKVKVKKEPKSKLGAKIQCSAYTL